MARVCIIRQQYYSDPRVARECKALMECGHGVDWICLRKAGEPLRERRGRLTIWRLPPQRNPGSNPADYLLYYATFFVLAAGLAAALHLRRRYRLVQVNTLPDVLVFAAAVPRLLGARVLLDLQECMPEFFASKFHTSLGSPAVRLIAALEQLSIRFADLVITPTALMREAFVSRGADPAKIFVIMDGADEAVFHPVPRTGRDRDRGVFTLLSHGTVEERYGLDTTIRAVALLTEEMPDLKLQVYGDGSYLRRLCELANELGVADRVSFSGSFVPIDQLVQAIADADVGVVAMKRDAFRDLTIAGKMFDFIVMRKPMVVSRTRSVEQLFDPSSFEMFESDDPVDLARAIRAIRADADHRAELVRRAAVAAEPYRWPHQRRIYLEVVNRLLGGRADTSSTRRPAAG
jgi:glycosyltransferase involved in cell wall biosynthesis